MNTCMTRTRSRAVLWLALAILTVGASACDSLLGTDRSAFASEARVLLEGTSTVPLHLVTSSNFVATTEPLSGELFTTLFFADTLTAPSLPVDQTYNIRGRDRFLIRVVNPDLDVTASIHLRVYLDGREVFNQRATMRDASLQYIAFYQP